MAKVKKVRKPREEMAKTHDLLFPIDVTQIGTETDPCFGKLNDPKAPECQRCGDCEYCQIVMAQNLHKTRTKIEGKGKFRDIEERDIPIIKKQKSPTIKYKKSIRELIRKHKTIDKAQLVDDISATHNIAKTKTQKILTSMLKVTTKFKLKKDKLIWNEK